MQASIIREVNLCFLFSLVNPAVILIFFKAEYPKEFIIITLLQEMSKNIHKYLVFLIHCKQKTISATILTHFFHCFKTIISVSSISVMCLYLKVHFETHQNVPLCFNYIFMQFLFKHSTFYSHYGHELYLHSNCFSSFCPRLLWLGSILLGEIVLHSGCIPLKQLQIFCVEVPKAL